MDILCTIDNNYVQQCCCMLVSFFDNNRRGKHSVHLFSEKMAPENQNIIRNLVESYQGIFYYYQVDSSEFGSCSMKNMGYYTMAIYHRLLMVRLLPDNLDRVLYLDCDLVVDGSLEEFWGMLLDNYALAAVDELNSCAPDVFERLGYDAKYGYFNAGVLLVNLKYWRDNNLTNAFLEYMSSHSDKLKTHDQDVLNALLHDKCKHVSRKWNTEEAFYHYYVIKKWRKMNSKEMKKVLFNPVIIHYSWKPKPWEKSCRHPLRLKYFFYLNKITLFSTYKPSFPERMLAHYDEFYFKLLLRLGVKGHRFYKLA